MFLPIVEPLAEPRLVPWVLLYIGPDMMMPFMSALAAAAGFLLMFWRRAVDLIRRASGGRSRPATKPSEAERSNQP